MNEPTQADLDAAQTLIPCNCGTKTHKHMTDCPRHGVAWEDVADALAAARDEGRAECKAPTGHIIDDQGVVRKILGTLPVTADGCVVGDVPDHGALLFLNASGDTATPYRVTLCCQCVADPDGEDEDDGWWVIENDELSDGAKRWYSTREAALAAKGVSDDEVRAAIKEGA